MRPAMPAESETAEIVVLNSALAALRDDFLGWQCRVRQLCVRRNGGMPLPAMRPRVVGAKGEVLSEGITTVLVQHDPRRATDMFRQVYRRTQDPRERYAKALEILAASHFQRPKEFTDEMTALFCQGSPLAGRLIRDRACVLEFDQFNQGYRIPCGVQELGERDIAYQATYWHNVLFNPALPPAPLILAFTPDWSGAHAFGEQF